MNELIEKVDFKYFEKYKGEGYYPVVIAFSGLAIQVDNWRDAMKLFFYYAFKNDGIREFIMNTLNVRNSENIFYFRISANRWKFANPVKFSSNLYFNTCIDKRKTVFDTERFTDNLAYINKIIQSVEFPDFELYLTKLNKDDDKLCQEQRKLIKRLTNRKCEVKRVEKNTKYIIAKINEEIYSPLEKLNLKVGKQFKKKLLIGDISLSEEDLTELKKHMTEELQRLNFNSSFKPHYPQLFALGLVRFAMKHYEQKTFWPYFFDEYMYVDGNKQGQLHDIFRSIMVTNGKKYDDDVAMKIDNISMHSFVTDKCAPQLFDYLFGFWWTDLHRNIENMNSKVFNMLLEEMSQTRQNVGDVMKHTSLALIHNKKSCILRIRRILNFIDDCFWNQTEVLNTGNRINQLLNKWMSNPKGDFQKAYQQKQKSHSSRGASLFAFPTICVDYNRTKFLIKLPCQILKGCTEDEYPEWKIEFENTVIDTVMPDLVSGKIAFQTDECEVALDSKYLFER